MLEIRNWFIKNVNSTKFLIKNANLTFKEGEMTSIIGLSGVGKTSLLKSFALQNTIYSGKILYKNKEINYLKKNDKKTFRKKIGIISQKSTLINDLSVFDNLKIEISNKNNFFFRFLNLITKKQENEIYQVLKKVNMLEKIFFLPSNLSGGEIQKIELAKLLVKKPKIILADEPTSNLDNVNAIEFINILKEYTKKYSAITIVNVHNTFLLKKFNWVIGIKNKTIEINKRGSDLNKKDINNLYEKL